MNWICRWTLRLNGPRKPGFQTFHPPPQGTLWMGPRTLTLRANVSPTCTFEGNDAGLGGGIYNDESCSPALTNTTFLSNSARGDGGGIYNSISSSPVLINCTFWGNDAASGGGIYNEAMSAPTVTNCILWGDTPDEIVGGSPAVTYSDVEGGHPGQKNIDQDPMLVDPANGDLHLGEDSPCIDEGSNAAPNLPLYDFEGDHRILDGDDDGEAIVDMGVDEAPGEHIPVPLEVEIDVTPNTPNNIIKLSSPSKVPVAILSDEDFDAASEADPESVLFAGAAHAGYDVQDVDNDGDDDLLLYFYPADMVDLTPDSRGATLTGMTFEGRPFEGTDRVRVKE